MRTSLWIIPISENGTTRFVVISADEETMHKLEVGEDGPVRACSITGNNVQMLEITLKNGIIDKLCAIEE